MSPYKDQDNLCFCSLPDLRVSLSYQSLKKAIHMNLLIILVISIITISNLQMGKYVQRLKNLSSILRNYSTVTLLLFNMFDICYCTI